MLKVGDKVICIDIDRTMLLEKYKLYTVEKQIDENNVLIKEIYEQHYEVYYRPSRFITLKDYRKLKLTKINYEYCR